MRRDWTSSELFNGWPGNVIITNSRKLGYAGGMNEKGHIFVNLGQIERWNSLNNRQI